MYTYIIIIANAWVQREKQRFAKRAQNTLTSHLLMPQDVLEIGSNPVQKDEKREVFKAPIIIIIIIIVIIVITKI